MCHDTIGSNMIENSVLAILKLNPNVIEILVPYRLSMGSRPGIGASCYTCYDLLVFLYRFEVYTVAQIPLTDL